MKNPWPFASLLFLFSCASQDSISETSVEGTTKEVSAAETKRSAATPAVPANRVPSDAATILARPQVPVLCYHHIRYPKPGKKSSDYDVTPDAFKAQMKILADSGYQTVLPDQYLPAPNLSRYERYYRMPLSA